MILDPQKRIAGILAPLFALRSEHDLGIGDVATLREFIDWSAEHGFHLVQMLPINETGGDNSPYNAISAMAIEPTTLHLAPGTPEDLTTEDFTEVTAAMRVESLRHGDVKYRRVKKLKRGLLEKAFERFQAGVALDRKAHFQSFRASERAWLDDYALFRVLMEEHKDSSAWDEWEQNTIEKARAWFDALPTRKKNRIATRRDFFAYVQWIAYDQWHACKTYADERGVALMGDIPFGISYYSADVFAQPNEFALDWAGGAPPEIYFKDDAFTQKWGQNWGIPIYRWDVMRANHFKWWRQRVSGVKRVFHVFRIDHVLGFYRIYAFPWRPKENQTFLPLTWDEMLQRTGGRAPHFAPRDDSNPQNAEANRREGEEYLRAVLEESGATRLVGEDLGTVPDYVRPNLHSLGIAGFKIPQWEAPQGNLVSGSQYERLSVATYATHDHKPVRSLWADAFEEQNAGSEQARGDLERIARFSGLQPKPEPFDFMKDFYPAMMRALFNCESWIAIVMITDLFAKRDRFNVPGTDAGTNWSRRMSQSIAHWRESRPVRDKMRLVKRLLEESGRA